MVWIHGGGLVFGAGSDYDPTPIVTRGNVIVVTINYRLGYLGFFAHPAIDAELHLLANYGLMDQQFALQWVQKNIAAFGGNPKRVTIFGESAGGLSVLSNVASPTAAGLFTGGIVESGGYAEFQVYWDPLSVVPLATAETIGTVFVPAGTTIATAKGCGTDSSAATAECLRAIPAANLAVLSTAFPIVDGAVLTQTLDSAFSNGAFNRVPVLAGTNHDEYRYFVAVDYDLAGNALTDAGYPAAVYALFGFPYPTPDNPFADSLINFFYPLTNYPAPVDYPGSSGSLALGALGTDWFFVCTQHNAELKLSAFVPTYVYEFHDETAPSIFPPLSFPPGDSHVVEVQYLFNFLNFLGIATAFTDKQQTLSDTMIAYWTNFAKAGNPNAAGLPVWSQFVAGGSLESLVAPTPVSQTDASFDSDHQCSSLWNVIP
jgi:para-nitrobenzyl esterase